MSAPQTPHAPVRLLIAERSENAAHQFDSLLRDAGIATRLEIIDLPMAMSRMQEADMMLCSAALPELTQLLPRLSREAPRVPIILVNSADASFTAPEGMDLGAADVVSDDQHLVLVVKREMENVCQNVQLSQTRRALAEAERRCQLLLQSSRAAIAYVHEGMHIYANEGYLKLFGFEDADDLLGLPLMDLMAGDSVGVLKTTLKQFREDEVETDFDFMGASTAGDVINGNITLAAAEYEGEHCLQVTVRTAELTATESLDPAAAEVEDCLTELSPDPLEFAPEAPGSGAQTEPPLLVETSNGGIAETNGTAAARARDGEHDAPARSEAAASSEAGESLQKRDSEDHHVADQEVVDEVAADENAAEDAADDNIGSRQNGTASVLNLGDFLTSSEAEITRQEGQFASIFVAQVDDHQALQREHGLAGAEHICRKVEATFSNKLNAPLMQLSPYQWAMLICEKTRDDALDTVDTIRREVETIILEVREKTVRPTATFGGAIFSKEGFDSVGIALEETLNAAFTTLKSAEETSKGNCIELPDFETKSQEIDDEANRVLALINEAIESQKFVLLFQPIISLRGDSDEHYEVFLRMIDRKGEQMAPGMFLRTAIDNGVAGKIDRWVILQSIKMLSNHRSKGHNTRLTINLTANSVTDSEFIQWLGVAIKAARLPSDAVIFQITERDAANYIRQTREFVEGMKSMHCRASLSRFGLEPEPFEVLKHFPVDFVKLDGSLIERLNNDPSLKDEVTETIRDLQGAGKLTIVPMVESASVLSTLWQAGANYIQGHYLQEPTTAMDYDFSTDD